MHLYWLWGNNKAAVGLVLDQLVCWPHCGVLLFARRSCETGTKDNCVVGVQVLKTWRNQDFFCTCRVMNVVSRRDAFKYKRKKIRMSESRPVGRRPLTAETRVQPSQLCRTKWHRTGFSDECFAQCCLLIDASPAVYRGGSWQRC